MSSDAYHRPTSPKRPQGERIGKTRPSQQPSAIPLPGATTLPDAAKLPPRKPGEPRQAVAITYDPENADAPVVTAAGQGLVAEEIIRRAQEAGVPVTEDPRLAAVLSQIDVGAQIPPELYAVVAEVLAYIYRLDDRVSRRRYSGLPER